MEPVAPSQSNTCAIVVTYHPDPAFRERMQSVAGQVAALLIVDNHSNAAEVSMLRAFADAHSVVHLLENEVNLGVATALNQGIQWAAERGLQWVYLLDQDTLVMPNAIDELERIYADYPEKEKIGQMCSNFVERGLGHAAYVPPGDDAPSDESRVWKQMPAFITAGSLIPMTVLEACGGFRDEYFIDHVDHEFCLRLRARGYQIVMAYEPLIEHAIGDSKMRWCKGYTFLTYNHSPIRYYYQTRNLVALTREFQQIHPAFLAELWWSYRRSLAGIVLFEQRRCAKLWQIALGYIDGLRGKMGPA